MKIKSFVEWMIEKRLNEEGEIVSVRWVHVLIDEWARHLKEDGVHQGDCTSESQPCEMCHIEMYLTEYYDYMKNFNKSKKLVVTNVIILEEAEAENQHAIVFLCVK